MKFLLAIFVATISFNDAVAQGVRLTAESQRTRERFDEGSELERQQKNDEALEHHLKLLADVPQEWVPQVDGRLLRPCRQVVLSRIAANPHIRAAYRARFEQPADAALRQANEAKDTVALERLVVAHWPTLAAAKAMSALGDLAFEHGDLPGALHWWRLLAGPHRQGEPIFPDPPMEVALVRAKYLLAARMLGGSVDTELEEFRREFPAAKGRLAGRDGLLADLISSLTKDAGTNLPRIEPKNVRTFGAAAQRAGATSERLPQLAPRRIEWPINWPSGEVEPDAKWPDRNPIASPRQLTTHPLLWSGKLIASDGERILAFHLDTGLVADVYGSGGRRDVPIAEPQTLTAHSDRLFARLNHSTIVALERDAASEQWSWKKVWELKASAVGEGVTFEGCPVVANDRVYLSGVAVAVNRATVTLACFPVDRPADGPLWTNTVAEIQLDPDVRRVRLPLLTLAGPNIVYGTDAGAVIALDAATGKPAWAARYASRGPRGLPANLLPVPRDLCPAAYSDGRVFVAPYDSDEVMAFDARTGIRLWERSRIMEIVHLLGVIDNRLIVTADGLYHGIGAIDVATGAVDRQWGDLRAAAPFGRGLIFGDCVLFPTRSNGLLVLGRDGRPIYGPSLFQNLPGGNLAYGDGVVVIATAEHLLRLSFTGPGMKPVTTP